MHIDVTVFKGNFKKKMTNQEKRITPKNLKS